MRIVNSKDVINFVKRNFFPSKLSLVLSVLLFFIFWGKAILFLDPDFGWRLRSGEIFLRQGIVHKDLFSYTMPSFGWVDHAWSQSIIFYLLYSSIGYVGLAFAYALFAILSLLISSLAIKKYTSSNKKNFKRRLSGTRFLDLSFDKVGIFANFPILLVASLFFTFFGIRAQVISWLFISILVVLLFDERFWNKMRFFLPILFFFWANLHGSFLSGLALLWFFLILKWYKHKKLEKVEFFISGVSTLVSLINPYGLGIWKEVWSSISDSKLRFSIIEWMPSLIMFDLAMVFLMGISLGLVFRYKDRFQLQEKGLYITLLLQALLSRRHLPLLAIVALPVIAKGIHFLEQDSRRVKLGVERFAKIYSTGQLITFFVFLIQAFFALNEAKQISFFGRFYPREATSYLSQDPPTGEIFSEYGWGGYLIWKLPSKKVFIDGRMPSWRWDPPTNELGAAFDTYNDIQRGKVDFEKIFSRFNVEFVLWSKPQQKSPLPNLYEKLEGYLEALGWKKSDFYLLEALEKDGWKKVYEDEVAVIYRKV